MKNLLIIIKVLMLFMVVGQSPVPSGNNVIKKDVVKEEIVKIQSENEKALQETAIIKLNNEKDLNEVQKMNIKKKSLIKSGIDKIYILLKKPKKTSSKKQIIYLNKTDVKFKELNTIKMDSVCVSEKRNDIFGKKKCDKWEYYTYIVDSNNNKIIIK